MSRLQADAVFLTETQINPVLVPRAFSLKDELFRGKESMSILANNKQEHLSIRQQGGVLAGVIGSVSSIAISVGQTLEDGTRCN